MEARNDMFLFLRAIGLHPLEWMEAIRRTRKPAPYIGDILKTAFGEAEAVVVLMTPDDVVYLRDDLRKKSEKESQSRPVGQARPNVLFEAGLAFASHPDKTVLVQMGDMREFSDIAGRHVQRMSGSPEDRTALATRLRNAGCRVNTDGQDWLSAGTFADPSTRAKARAKKKS
jgi:predicted nucleotide-binding protein